MAGREHEAQKVVAEIIVHRRVQIRDDLLLLGLELVA